MKQKNQSDKPENPGVLNCSIFLSDKKKSETDCSKTTIGSFWLSFNHPGRQKHKIIQHSQEERFFRGDQILLQVRFSF